jgi:hypothetical protein
MVLRSLHPSMRSRWVRRRPIGFEPLESRRPRHPIIGTLACCAYGDRPGGRGSDERDELAPPHHSITSSALGTGAIGLVPTFDQIGVAADRRTAAVEDGGFLLAAVTYYPLYVRLGSVTEPSNVNYAIAIIIVAILVSYVGMVYGPIGAFLAEYFPGIRSSATRLTAVHEMRCSARPFAESTSAPPSGHSRRTRLRRPRSASSPCAQQGSSAGGCAGSVGRTRFSTTIQTLRSACRAYLRRASAPPF